MYTRSRVKHLFNIRAPESNSCHHEGLRKRAVDNPSFVFFAWFCVFSSLCSQRKGQLKHARRSAALVPSSPRRTLTYSSNLIFKADDGSPKTQQKFHEICFIIPNFQCDYPVNSSARRSCANVGGLCCKFESGEISSLLFCREQRRLDVEGIQSESSLIKASLRSLDITGHLHHSGSCDFIVASSSFV